jgi:glucose-1-phosphate adenylyltransferase
MPLFTNARMLPPAKIHSSYIQDSLIAEASVVVSAHVSNSVIGLRSYIGRNATVKNVVMIGSDYMHWHDLKLHAPVKGPEAPGIDEETYIEGAIVDKNVHIGKRCVIKNRDQVSEGEGPGFYIRDGVVVITKNSVIPDDTII